MTFTGRRTIHALLVFVAVSALALALTAAPAAADPGKRAKITNIVVIYEENHSFDNLFGGWERVDGTRGVTQVGQDGTPCRACRRTTSTSPRRHCR